MKYLRTLIFGGNKIILFIILSSLCLYSCNNEKDENLEVANVIYKLIEADNNSNVQAILNSYTDSVEFFPAGKDFIKGLNNVKNNYDKLFLENKISITTQIIETKVIGNDAIVIGTNKGIKKSVLDFVVTKINDKYIAILVKNSNDEWKIDKLIWSMNK